jgi:putative lipoic acid-binding regulatory protein
MRALKLWRERNRLSLQRAAKAPVLRTRESQIPNSRLRGKGREKSAGQQNCHAGRKEPLGVVFNPARGEGEKLTQEYENLKLLLEEAHSFPGPYTFKIIGPNTPAWQETVEKTICSLLEDVRVDRKISAAGAYLSLSLKATLPSSSAVLEAYAALSKLDNVKMLV